MTSPHIDWDVRSAEVLANQITAYDAQRAHCPVAYSSDWGWSVLKHAHAVRVLEDPDTFSNVVSRHVSVPNGMDPPQHTTFRALVDRYFSPARITAFEPTVRRIAATLVEALPRDEELDFMGRFAEPFANQVQCAFMGWPDTLHDPLREWTVKNQRATLAMDRAAMAAVAMEFDHYISEQIERRRAAGPDAPDDVTTELLHDTVDGRAVTNAEIVSIVRNWTVGELATIAASAGIIAHHLSTQRGLQAQLREEAHDLEAASDEILRIHPPLIANRRRTTRDVTIGECDIPAGEHLLVVWASVNRDEDIFGDPDEFRLDRDPGLNLLYGSGIHYCPGAALARLELRVLMEELFAGTMAVEPAAGSEPVRASYPASGFASLPLLIR